MKNFKYGVFDLYDSPIKGDLISTHSTLEEAKKAAIHYTIHDCDGEAFCEIWKINENKKKFVRVW